MPHDVFWSPDEGIRFIMARTRMDTEPASSGLPYPGKVLDPEYQFFPNNFNSPRIMYPVPRPDGTIRFPWPVWFSTVAGRLYDLLGSAGPGLLPLFAGWLGALLAGWIGARLDSDIGSRCILAVGLGTPIFFYSLVFWDHTLATVLALLATSLLLFRLGSWPVLLFSLPLLFLACLLRVELGAFLLAVLVAWVVTLLASRKWAGSQCSQENHKDRNLPDKVLRLVWIPVLVFILALSLTASFQQKLILPRHLTEVSRWLEKVRSTETTLFTARLATTLPELLINKADSESPPLTSAWSRIGSLALLVCAVATWHASKKWEAFLLTPSFLFLLGLSLAALLEPYPYRALHGFFLPFPAAALSVGSLAFAWRARRPQLLFLSLLASLYLVAGLGLILLARGGNEGGYQPGLEWGLRYLLPLYPLLAILTIYILKNHWQAEPLPVMRKIITLVAILMFLVGAQFQARGVWMLRDSRMKLAEWQNLLKEQSPAPIVTDLWWLPASLASYFTTHEMYSVRQEVEVLDWSVLAAGKGIEEALFVGLSPWDNGSLENSVVRLTPVENVNLAGLYATRLRLELVESR